MPAAAAGQAPQQACQHVAVQTMQLPTGQPLEQGLPALEAAGKGPQRACWCQHEAIVVGSGTHVRFAVLVGTDRPSTGRSPQASASIG
jgi:hypothetical protein